MAQTGPRRWLALALAGIGLMVAGGSPAQGSNVTGAAGIDTSLPATESRVTVSGRGKFADLKITVNQTKELLNQAISVTWTGGVPTKAGPGDFARNYLQLMQCWGDDDGSVAQNPGPPPTQCVAGATNAVPGGRTGNLFPGGSFATERILSRRDWANFDPEAGAVDEKTGYLWQPFRSVTGRTVGVHVNSSFNPTDGGEFWLNEFFNVITTNEINAGRTGPNGTGAELFEVNTGVESTGLGCGQRVQDTPSGKKIPKCWLVVVPRGEPAEENAGTPFADAPDQWGVMTSPLSPTAWKNRIAIPLDFVPVETSCSLADDQRRIVGSELLSAAMSSWQRKLCSVEGLSPYAFGTIADSSARTQLVNPVPGSPGLIAVSRPVDQELLDPESPIVYAPLTVSGLVIGFNSERYPRVDADAEAQSLAGIRVAEINLTPRLVAKLLTQSYSSQVRIKGGDPGYPWLESNAAHLGVDPDFLQFNPEFRELQIARGKNFGGLLLPPGNSDAARQVWEYVLADPEAKAWLEGAPDPFGMKVNPLYAELDPPPNSFPKADPYCYQGEPVGHNHDVVPPPLCGTDWLPYVLSMREGARLTRAADDGAKVIEDPVAQRPEQVYKRDLPQQVGSRVMLSLTDTASAFQYGVQTARLSRAGDNGNNRKFIAPNKAGLVAGVDGMKPKAELAVLEADPRAKVDGGYPLTSITYGAIKPLSLDEIARREYAAFVAYAAEGGQVEGPDDGELPGGYAPLPPTLRSQSANAAKTIVDLTPAALAEEAEEAAREASGDGETGVSSSDTGGSGGRSSSGRSLTTPFLAVEDPAQPNTAGVGLARAARRFITPVVSAAVTRFALPTLLLLSLLSALGAVEITRRPNRTAHRTSS